MIKHEKIIVRDVNLADIYPTIQLKSNIFELINADKELKNKKHFVFKDKYFCQTANKNYLLCIPIPCENVVPGIRSIIKTTPDNLEEILKPYCKIDKKTIIQHFEL